MLKNALIRVIGRKMSIDPYLFAVTPGLARYIHVHHFVCVPNEG